MFNLFDMYSTQVRAKQREAEALVRLSVVLPYAAQTIAQCLDGHPDKVGYCEVAYRLVSAGDTPFTKAFINCLERGGKLPELVTPQAISEISPYCYKDCLGWAEVTNRLGRDAAWAVSMMQASDIVGADLLGQLQRLCIVREAKQDELG